MVIVNNNIVIRLKLDGFADQEIKLKTIEDYRSWVKNTISLHQKLAYEKDGDIQNIGKLPTSSKFKKILHELKDFSENQIKNISEIQALELGLADKFPKDLGFGANTALGNFLSHYIEKEYPLAVNVAERLFGEIDYASRAEYSASVQARAIYLVGELSAGAWKPQNQGSLPHYEEFKKFKAEIDQQIELSKKELDEISDMKENFVEFMKLKAPREFWAEKARSHGTRELNIGWFLVTLSIFAFISIIVLLHKSPTIVENFTEAPPQYALIQTGLAVTFTTLAIWFGRILTRTYLAEKHLRMDAEERTVLVQTWLALNHEGEVGPEERKIVLASLFRHTEDGIVKDDALPTLDLLGIGRNN